MNLSVGKVYQIAVGAKKYAGRCISLDRKDQDDGNLAVFLYKNGTDQSEGVVSTRVDGSLWGGASVVREILPAVQVRLVAFYRAGSGPEVLSAAEGTSGFLDPKWPEWVRDPKYNRTIISDTVVTVEQT